MRPTGVKFLAKAADAVISGDPDRVVFDVKIDSRQAGEGDMFVCVTGENNDGHNFIPGAYENGCRVFLVSDEWKAAELVEKDPEVCCIIAGDTSIAFRDMARACIDQFEIARIGITGSVGKTSTRVYTAAVLGAKRRVISSQKNLNTHLGLCLTCFLADESTELIVFEMGMDRKNEIAEYVDWVFPETAVITNVGISHMEKLGSRDAIADAKLEIVKNFGPENILIYNSLSDYLNPQEIKRRAPGEYGLWAVGTSGDCHLRVYNIESPAEGGVSFTLESSSEKVDVHMQLLGKHNAIDAALAASVGLRYGVDLKSAAQALAKVKPTYRRLDAVMLGSVYIIDDTYNASPDSMKAALDVMGDIKAERKIAVLADMLELGDALESGHREVGACAGEKGIDVLYAIGSNAKLYCDAARSVNPSMQIIHAEKLQDIEPEITSSLRPGDAVLIKGSNITGVAGLAERLREKFEKEE